MNSTRRNRLRAVVAVWCMGLLLIPQGGFVPSAAAQEGMEGSRIKQVVEALGVGVEVDLTLDRGDKIRGVIRELREAHVGIEPARPPFRHYPYAEIRELTLPRMTYSTSGTTDAVAVKRIVTVIGPDKNVQVRTMDDRRMRGRVQGVGENDFTVVTGESTVTIAYDQVTQVRRSGISAWRVAGVVAAIWGGLALLVLASGGWSN